MKTLFFLFFPFLFFAVAATSETSITTFLSIKEGPVTYNQTVTFDFENQFQLVEVPAHNNVVHSKSFFYFNQGTLVEAQPEIGVCYIKPIPETTPPIQTFANTLINRKAEVELLAKNSPIAKRFFLRSAPLDLSVLEGMPEAFKECQEREIFETNEIFGSEEDGRFFFQTPVEMSSRLKIEDGKCPFPNSCIWQTCTVGNSSCYWTANCPMGDTQCEDMIHNANFEVNGDPVSCDVCFNTYCSRQCRSTWEECNNGSDLPNEMQECTNNATIGNFCDHDTCTWPNEKVYMGRVECPQDKVEDGLVLAGNTCTLTCLDGHPGGYLKCEETGSYEDNTWCDPPTQFDDC